MIRMFDAFRKWCDQNGVPSHDIEITVSPRTNDTARRLEAAWHQEMSNLTVHPASNQIPTAGKIYSIPFRYRRPFETERPFGDTKG